ncbi:MAG: alpha-2-macroglobulin, partial [Bacteroidales bacterium]|nr:alpha-2-macroglobulin [Bacteroidales bacterium]
GNIEQVFAIGGDEELSDKGKKKADRFKPVVKYIGPFNLKKGKSAKHTIKLPKYIGAVRTMIVAGRDGAYGFAEKSTPVKSPLMLLSTLPRVLSPTETVKMPVTIFAMDNKIKTVNLRVETNEFIELIESKNQQIAFSEPGEQNVLFNIKVKEKLGIAKIKIIAESGKEKAEYEMELDVRVPNPKVTDIYAKVIQPGESWTQDFSVFGIEGTNEAILDVANIPPIDFGRRLKFLIKYPHGCIEQTTSSVFPQLFLGSVMEISDETKDRIHANVVAGINRLKTFQLSDGGLGYWPGATDPNDWGTSYAGHFMLEAEALGYDLPIGFKDQWISFQQREANNWQYNGHKYSLLIQAYRLYTLALAGEPEIGAMNRLREMPNLNIQSKWRLAAS